MCLLCLLLMNIAKAISDSRFGHFNYWSIKWYGWMGSFDINQGLAAASIVPPVHQWSVHCLGDTNTCGNRNGFGCFHQCNYLQRSHNTNPVQNSDSEPCPNLSFKVSNKHQPQHLNHTVFFGDVHIQISRQQTLMPLYLSHPTIIRQP